MNLGTFVVLMVLTALVALILRNIRKDKRSGKSTCGGNCGACGAGCHAAVGNTRKNGAQGKALIVTTLSVDGMSCSMCESHVNDAIRNAFPVKTVRSSARTGKTIIVSEEVISEQALQEALSPTGYRLLSFSCAAEAC